MALMGGKDAPTPSAAETFSAGVGAALPASVTGGAGGLATAGAGAGPAAGEGAETEPGRLDRPCESRRSAGRPAGYGRAGRSSPGSRSAGRDHPRSRAGPGHVGPAALTQAVPGCHGRVTRPIVAVGSIPGRGGAGAAPLSIRSRWRAWLRCWYPRWVRAASGPIPGMGPGRWSRERGRRSPLA